MIGRYAETLQLLKSSLRPWRLQWQKNMRAANLLTTTWVIGSPAAWGQHLLVVLVGIENVKALNRAHQPPASGHKDSPAEFLNGVHLNISVWHRGCSMILYITTCSQPAGSCTGPPQAKQKLWPRLQRTVLGYWVGGTCCRGCVALRDTSSTKGARETTWPQAGSGHLNQQVQPEGQRQSGSDS